MPLSILRRVDEFAFDVVLFSTFEIRRLLETSVVNHHEWNGFVSTAAGFALFFAFADFILIHCLRLVHRPTAYPFERLRSPS